MAGQPQSYGSIREFLDNLPSQPCIWQPDNANICVTCLRINEPVARVCSVWAQALEDAPLEQIDFEEEVKSLPSVVEIEDDFEMVEPIQAAIPMASPVAEVDIVEATSDWDMQIDDVSTVTTGEVAGTVIEEATEAFEEVVQSEVLEPESTDMTIAVDATEEVTEAVIEAATDATEEVVEEAVTVEESADTGVDDILSKLSELDGPVAEATEEIAEAVVAVEATEDIAEAVVAVEATEEIALDTIQDAVEAENIAKENVESASETEIITSEAIVEAIDTETEAVESYAEAVKEEVQAADAVVEAVEAKNIATEAVIESAEQVTELVENEAAEEDITEIVTELKENIEKQEEADLILTEAITNEDKAAEEVESTSTKEDQASDNLDKAIKAGEKASEKLEEAVIKEEKAEEEVQEAVETSKPVETSQEEDSNDSEPFLKGDSVTHGVYGSGTVLQLNKAGKHWSVEVNFDEGKRRILGTFLTLNEIDETPIAKKNLSKDDFKRPKSKEIEENDNEIAEVVADVVEIDHGDYPPGVTVTHDIFGKGEIKNSKPKGEAYRLDLVFEDGTERTLLSTFVNLGDEQYSKKDNSIEAEPEPVEAEPVPIEAEPEPVEAEPVPVEAEPVLDTDVVYQRPKKDKEVILDLSKPEIQDAEMIDDEDK
ncbi:MAG: hypothetical protein BET99_00185 [Marine Group III euryarchaeote CG-Epi2]|uniref:Uncharacterized protein n=1 Tax=Marine Group III euryarchaeote CG-Epi2 TaxID=1888996 RepID=A0A1J5UB35_9ARCH|nr:MAG: hypothetical protein BET99_00185 [Marine Group III euryarchaeote CG-Epi2]